MDYLGAHGVGMIIDFATGLAMKTKDPQPSIIQLDVNHKGHYVLNIVEHLTRGQSCQEGQAHVVVRNQPSTPKSSSHLNHDFIELATVWFDLAVGERDPHEHELAVARDRVWMLYHHARTTSSSAAATAQMCGVSYAPLNSTTTSSRTHGVSLARDADSGPRDRGDPGGIHESKGQAEATTSIIRSGEACEGRPPRSEDTRGAVAVLQQAHSGATDGQPVGPMDHMPVLQSQAALHSSEGSASEHYGHGQPCNGEAHAIGATSAPGGNEAHVDYLPPRDEQDHGGDCAPQGSAGTGEWPDGRHRLNPSSARDLGDDFTDYELNVGHAAGRRRGADSGLRERDHRVLMRPSGVDSKGVPLYIGKKLMAMAAMMTTATTSLLLGLHLEGRDGLWEITCAPHTEEHGLQPRRINRTSGYDLYKAETWEELRQLRRRKWPRRLWFSLPYTKWDHWSSVNYNTEDKKERLDTARRKERRLLWYANQFIKEATREDEEVDVYFEWPHPGTGWRQQPMVDLEEFLHEHGTPWLPCRVDGCVYDMKDTESRKFVKKAWMIKTTDERFHKVFRAKVCRGQHGHHHQGAEGDTSTFYPSKLVQSITRHWRDQLVPPRHLQLLRQREDQAALIEEFPRTGEDEADAGLLEEEPLEAAWCDEEDLTASAATTIMVESMAREARAHGNFDSTTLQSILLELRAALQARSSSGLRWQSSTSSTSRLTLGGYSHGSFHGICKATLKFPEVTRYLNYYLRRHVPQHVWTSVLVGFNSAAVPHRDHHNLKDTLNLIHGIGDYQDGGLWLEGDPPNPGMLRVRRRLQDGSMAKGYVVATEKQVRPP